MFVDLDAINVEIPPFSTNQYASFVNVIIVTGIWQHPDLKLFGWLKQCVFTASEQALILGYVLSALLTGGEGCPSGFTTVTSLPNTDSQFSGGTSRAPVRYLHSETFYWCVGHCRNIWIKVLYWFVSAVEIFRLKSVAFQFHGAV